MFQRYRGRTARCLAMFGKQQNKSKELNYLSVPVHNKDSDGRLQKKKKSPRTHTGGRLSAIYKFRIGTIGRST